MRNFNMRLLRLDLGPQGSVAAISGDAHAVHASAGARRNETANNDIFLQADAWVLLALNRGFGENAGRLLELRGRETAAGLQDRLRNADKDGLALIGLLTRLQPGVVIVHFLKFN